MMQKIRSLFVAAVALAASFISSSALAATPLVVWDSDFNTTAKTDTRGQVWTFDKTACTLAEDGSSFTVTTTNAEFRTNVALPSQDTTVLLRYSAFTTSTSYQTLISFTGTNKSAAIDLTHDLIGLASTPQSGLTGMWQGVLYSSSGNVNTYTLPTTGATVAITRASSGVKGYVDGQLDNNQSKIVASDFRVNQVNIGGQTWHKTGSVTVPVIANGLTVTGVAIFNSVLTAEDISAYKWSTKWIGTEGNWSDETKWSNGVPAANQLAVISAGAVVNVDGAIASGVAVQGAGRIIYNGKLPGNEKTGYQAATWTGTVELRGTIQNIGLNISDYGNENSTICLNGVTGYIGIATQNITHRGNFEIGPNGLSLTGGFSNSGLALSGKIFGTGDITCGWTASSGCSGNNGNIKLIGDLSGYTGKLKFASGSNNYRFALLPEEGNPSSQFTASTCQKTIFIESGMSVASTMIADSSVSKIHGLGTVIYNGVLPGNEKTSYQAAATWTGTVWLKNKNTDGEILFGSYGNASSFIKLTDFCGYLPKDGSVSATVELDGESSSFALKLMNGFSSNYFTFAKLIGSGKLLDGNGATQRIQITNGTEFTGDIDVQTGKQVVFGSTSGNDAMRIVIMSENVAKVASGKTWTASNGIFVNGTLICNGSLSGATTFNAGSTMDMSDRTAATALVTGNLTLNDNMTIKLPENATSPYALASGTITATDGDRILTIGDWTGIAKVSFANGEMTFKKIGNGTEDDPYVVSTEADLNEYAAKAPTDGGEITYVKVVTPTGSFFFTLENPFNVPTARPVSLIVDADIKSNNDYVITIPQNATLYLSSTNESTIPGIKNEGMLYANNVIIAANGLSQIPSDISLYTTNGGRSEIFGGNLLDKKVVDAGSTIALGGEVSFGDSASARPIIDLADGTTQVVAKDSYDNPYAGPNLKLVYAAELGRGQTLVSGILSETVKNKLSFFVGDEEVTNTLNYNAEAGTITTSTLNAQVVRNGGDPEMFEDLPAALDELEETDTGVTITLLSNYEDSETALVAACDIAIASGYAFTAKFDLANGKAISYPASATVTFVQDADDYRIVTKDGVTSVKLNGATSYTWTGAIDNDWAKDGNWSPVVGYPGLYEDDTATFPAFAAESVIALPEDEVTIATLAGAFKIDLDGVEKPTTASAPITLIACDASGATVTPDEEVEGYYLKTDATGLTYRSNLEFLRYGYAFENNVNKEEAASSSITIGDVSTYEAGVRTRALAFRNGKNYGADFGFGSGDFTIFAVIKAPTETGKCIFSLGGKQGTDGLLGLRTAGANSVAVFTKGSTDLMTVSVEDSATMYHYYALKYDSTAHTIALSVDGGEFGEPVEYTCSTAGQFQFGGIYGGGTSGKTDNATNGAIDEFQLYTKKLAIQQIQTLGAAFEPNTWKGANGGAWATASNWSYNEVPADGASVIIPTGDTAEAYKIVLASDATISLGSVKVTGAATSFEFENGEVTMGALKSDVDIQIGENDTLCFSTANAITLAANKFIKGNGTIVYVNVLPGNEKTSYQAAADWTGTVWLKDYTTSVGWVYGNQYGNANSKIKLTNFVGYFYPYEAQTITAELVLVDEDDHAAYTLRNGSSTDNVFINKLSGSGSIVGWGADATQRLLVKDWIGYAGNLNMFGGRGVKFGADGQAEKNHIEIGAGATYTLNGQSWTAEVIDVNGTICGEGTLNGAIVFGPGSVLDSTQGMLTAVRFGMSTGALTIKVVADATEEPKVMNGAFADVDTPVVYNATLVNGGETLEGEYMLVTRKDGVYAVKQSQPVNLQLVVNAGETKTFTADETVQYVYYPSLNADGTIAVDVANLEAGAYDLAVWKNLPAATFAGYGRPQVNIANIPEGWDAELMFQVDKISLLLRDPEWISRTPITIMPLGDSITESVASFYSNYRVLLYQKLALAGYNVKSAGYWRGALNGSREPTGVNTTHTEWELQAGKASERAGKQNTSANLEDGWSNMLDLAGDPDVILLHIGINDIDDPYETTYAYITDLTKKIMNARPNSVLVLSAPMGAEYGQKYQQADTKGDRAHNNYDETWVMPLHDMLVEFFNDAKEGNIDGIDKDRIFFADLTTNVRGRWYADEVNVPYYCLDDHLHPGWIGDNLMANTWFEQVRAAFPDPTAKFHEGRTDVEKGIYTDEDLGAENNVPDDYKAGFVKARQLKKSLTGTEHFTPGDSFTYDDTNENLADNVKVKKVGYYVEYVRETPTKNIHRFVWVDMDALDNQTLADVGFPYAAKNQNVVSKLHVYGNHPGVYNVDSNDDTVTGFVEFTPYGYSSGASSVSGAPAHWYELDWNDTLNNSGSGYGCMQVHRILNPAEFSRQGQVVFAYNGWSYSDNKTELGIGNFGQFFTTKSVDWTWLHNTELGAASNYKIQNIEIWIKPTDLVTDDDGKVYETIEDAINNGERQEGATLTANKDTNIALDELTSDKPFKLDAKAIAMDKIGWTDIAPTDAEGSGKYLACGSDGTLTVKTGAPTTDKFTSFECYVLGIDASKEGGDKPVLNAPPDDGDTNTLTASIDTARTIKGVNIKLIAEPNDKSDPIEATGNSIPLGLPGSGERIYTIKVEVEEATNP